MKDVVLASWTSQSRAAIIGRVIEHRTHPQHSKTHGRARSEHSFSRARRAPGRLLSGRPDLSTPLRVATPASLTSTLVGVIALPLRAVQGLHAVAAAVLQIPTLTNAVGDLHAELVGLRADLSGMPADSRRLADDVEVVHGELRLMHADLEDVKASVAPVHGDLSRVEAGLAPLPDQLDDLLPKIDELSARLDRMRGELAEQLDGMRTDLSGLPFVSKSS
jgi:hypothetical protein